MTSTTILTLPPELIETIAERVEPQSDLFALRAVCHYLDAILTRRCLSSIYMDFSSFAKNKGPPIQDLVTERTRVHIYAKELRVMSLATPNNAELRSGGPAVVMERGGGYSYVGYPLTDPMDVQAETILNTNFPLALKYFDNLESVEWATSALDIPCANQAVMDMLCAQPNLAKLQIDMSHDLRQPFPELGRLSRLSHLHITFPRNHVRSHNLFLGTIQAIRNSPDLKSLGLLLQLADTHPDLPTFYLVYDAFDTLQRLTELNLEVPRLTISRTAAGHLKNLTSLGINTLDLKIGYKEMWEAFQENQIHLTKIRFNVLNMEDAFLDYLESYSGAEELRLSNVQAFWIDVEHDDTLLASRFFARSIQTHSKSVRVLDVETLWPSAWCLIPRLKWLIKLEKLEYLRVDLDESELGAVRNPQYARIHAALNTGFMDGG